MKLIETCFLHKEANGSKFHWISRNYWKEGGIWCRISLWTKAGVLVGSMLVCRYTHWCVHVEFRGQRKRMHLWIAAVKWHKPWRTWSWPSKWHCSKWHPVDVSPSPRGYSSSMIFFLFSNALGHFCLLNRFAARVFLSPRTTGLGGSEHPTEDPVPSTPSSPKKKGQVVSKYYVIVSMIHAILKKCMILWKKSRFAMFIFHVISILATSSSFLAKYKRFALQISFDVTESFFRRGCKSGWWIKRVPIGQSPDPTQVDCRLGRPLFRTMSMATSLKKTTTTLESHGVNFGGSYRNHHKATAV